MYEHLHRCDLCIYQSEPDLRIYLRSERRKEARFHNSFIRQVRPNVLWVEIPVNIISPLGIKYVPANPLLHFLQRPSAWMTTVVIAE